MAYDFFFEFLFFYFNILTAATEYVSAEGKTKANMMFSSDAGQAYLEISKTVIRVRLNICDRI